MSDLEDSDNFSLPTFVKWTIGQIYNYSEQIVDYNSLDDLEETIKKARRALFILTDKINEYDRKERESKVAYDRAWRREYLLSTEKTDAARRARADLKCEEFENEWMTYDQLKKELDRTANSMRLELQTLQATGNNLRQQLKTL